MNLNYTTSQIAKILDADIINCNDELVQHITIDSRNYFGEKNRLFIALEGGNNNGHDYLQSLYEQGCKIFIITKKDRLPQGACGLIVKDTLQALQSIATHHRLQFDFPVIGITGSNGKTIVKEWIYHFLKTDFKVVRSPKSYNSKIGVPLSILQFTKNHTLAIIEAGISHPNEMQALQKMIRPTCGVLTHIGTAHSENFKNSEAISLEKKQLFATADWIYDYADNETYITKTTIGTLETSIEINWNSNQFTTLIPFTDHAAIQNAITTIIFLLKFGITPKKIQAQSPHLPSIALRLETQKGTDQNIIINDSYSNDLISFEIALNYLSNSKERAKKIVILSDIEQDKHIARDLYSIVAKQLKSRNIDRFFAVGKKIFRQRHLFEKGLFFETTQQFLNYLPEEDIQNSLILIKGARKYNFEKIGKYFEYKSHQTKLTIDLDALRNNVKIYQKELNDTTKLLCMVKAYGYGSGSKEIGKTLEQCNIDYLGVAYADEGKELRGENIQLPIIVMNAETGSFDNIIKYKLEPSIYSFQQLDLFIHALIDLGIKSYPIHLKMDTGMKRLGFLTEEIEELISTIASQPEVRVKSIFSHLAASDSEIEDLFTNKQIQRFQYACHQIETGLGYECIKHILNTSGIERFDYAQMDMVRLGLGMFGISDNLNALQSVGKLTSVISQIKKIKKGESVGYNRAQYALKDMTIGIVPIGYADGFARRLSNGKGSILINNKKVHVFGNVCMDMTMFDITDVAANEGDEVEIFGTNRSIKDLANEMDTITYEVMTSISQRVVRIYTEGV